MGQGRSRNIAPAVEALLALPSSECRVVIEAGDLRRTAPLRALVRARQERSGVALLHRRWRRELAKLIDAEMHTAGLTLKPEARAMLMPLLGGDRAASRNELRKLALYARGRAEVGVDDIVAVVSDASELALDDLVDAVFAGRPAEFGETTRRRSVPPVPPWARSFLPPSANSHSCTDGGR